MKDKKKIKIAVAMRKTTTKEKIIGIIIWAVVIGGIVYLVIK